MKIHKKIPMAIMALSTLVVTTSCNASLSHPLSCNLKVYQADVNHNGKIDDEEKHLTWAESFDTLMKQTANAAELKRIADIMNIADENDPKSEFTVAHRETLARYEILHQAEELLMSTGCILPIYNYEDSFMIKEGITGIYCSGLGYKFFESLTGKSSNKYNVCVGSKAATMDPTKNSTVEVATMISAGLMGMKKWTPAPTESKPYNCKLKDGCGICIKREENDKIIWDMYIGRFKLLEGKPGTKLEDYQYLGPVYWDDGKVIEPDDFIKSWNRGASSAAGTSFSSMFDCIVGYSDWHSKEAKEITYEALGNGMKGLKGYKSNDPLNEPHRFTATLSTDCAYFEELLTFPCFMPLPFHHMVSKRADGKLEIDDDWFTYPNMKGDKKIVDNGTPEGGTVYFCGNAALKYSSIDNVEGGSINLTPNDKYKENGYTDKELKENPFHYVDSLSFKLIDDDVNILTKYKNNELDFIDSIANGSIDDMKARYPKEFKGADQISLYYYEFNVNDNVFDMSWNMNLPDMQQERMREKLRQVMILLVNRNDICKSIGKSGQTPSSGMVSNGIPENVLPRKGDISKGENPNKIYARTNAKNELESLDWQERNNYQEGKLLRFDERDNVKNVDPSLTEKGITYGFSWTYDGKKDLEHYDDNVKFVMEKNIEKAITLAKEAGIHYDENSGKFIDFPEIKLTMNTGTGHEQVAERMQFYYSLFGINLKVETQEWNSFCAAKRSGDYAFGRNGWVADYSDPKTYLDVAQSDSGNNEMQIGKSTDNPHIHYSR